MDSGRDKGKGKVSGPSRRGLRGGTSTGAQTRGRVTRHIPPPSRGPGEFASLFADEEIPITGTVGGDRKANLSFDDLDDENEGIPLNIPIADVEQFIDGENQRDHGNPRPASSRSTGFVVDVEGICN